MPYEVIQVPLNNLIDDEPMGTKQKFWTELADGEKWLFKFARANSGLTTGEDWAEKVAHELGSLIGLPTAQIELATCDGRRGTVSKDFTRRRAKQGSTAIHAQLTHGNELLVKLCDSAYPAAGRFRVSEHTVSRILEILVRPEFRPPIDMEEVEDIDCAADVFAGYLLLDAWIGNTDRHHENWGVLNVPEWNDQQFYLAPSFDHASSMGRNMSEQECHDRLTTKDRMRTVTHYASRARSAIYQNVSDSKPLSPIAAFRHFAEHRPGASALWQSRLASVSDNVVNGIINSVPATIMGQVTKDFVREFLTVNRLALLQ